MRLIPVVALLLAACTSTVTVPSPSPAATPVTTATPTATPTPTASPRQVRPFERVVTIPTPAEQTYIAVDRELVAFVEGSAVSVVEVGTGQKRGVYQATPGWSVALSPRGLRGNTLVILESRTEGQRTDGRAVRFDLQANTRTTLDEWSGPYLGGGDTLVPEPPITNGTDVVWIRITDEIRPFAVDVVLARGAAVPRVISTNASPKWVDLHDDGSIAVSMLTTTDGRAGLALWRDGQVTSLGMRASHEGGPARFFGDRVVWAGNPGFVERVTSAQLIAVGGAVQAIDLGGCWWIGATLRHLAVGCGTGTSVSFMLLDPATGTRGDAIAATSGFFAGPRAAVWREGTQWWLGILAP